MIEIAWDEPNTAFAPWKLTADEIRAWVKALRSRGYHKTREVLMRRGAYCAMGVLASSRGELDGNRYGLCETSLEGHPKIQQSGELPYFVYALTDGVYDKFCCVTQLNDHGLSFAGIATVIEEMLNKGGLHD